MCRRQCATPVGTTLADIWVRFRISTFEFGTVNRIVDAICKFVDIGRSHVHYVSHHQVGYMRKAADSLGEFEQLVLTSVLLLGEHAYGLAMHAKISELAAPRNVRLGAVYMTLDRLKDKGLLRSWMSGPTPERGGRSKRYYELTARGARALKQSTTTAKRISDAVDKLRGLGKWKLDRI